MEGCASPFSVAKQLPRSVVSRHCLYFPATWEDLYLIFDQPLTGSGILGEALHWWYRDALGVDRNPTMLLWIPGFPNVLVLWGTEPGTPPYTRVWNDNYPTSTVPTLSGDTVFADARTFSPWTG